MVRDRSEIEADWAEEGRDIIFNAGDRQIWSDAAEEEVYFVNWATGRLKVYKLVDPYQRKTEVN